MQPASPRPRVSDGHGLIVARTDRFHELVGQPATADHEGEATSRSDVFVTKDRDGVPVMLARHWSGISGWRSAAWVPLSILEAPARQLWLALAAFQCFAAGFVRTRARCTVTAT